MSQGNIRILRMKRNDTLPLVKISVVERDLDNPAVTTPVDLTGASAKFIMVTDADPRVVKVNAAATITDALNGKVEYSWISADTDTSGDYLAEFEITLTGGKITLPSDDSLKIKIIDDYDNA